MSPIEQIGPMLPANRPRPVDNRNRRRDPRPPAPADRRRAPKEPDDPGEHEHRIDELA